MQTGGVWRTIGGRRVFIKTGQSLSDAMIKSGKFKRKFKNEEHIELEEKVYVEYLKAQYNLGLELGMGDDETLEEYLKRDHPHEKKMFEENKEAFMKEYENREFIKKASFDELPQNIKESRYKDAALHYASGDYIDMINYQLGKKVKGELENVKKRVEALEHLATVGSFTSDAPYYRGMTDFETKGLKEGGTLTLRESISSWSGDKKIAERFMGNDKAKDKVMIINKGGRYGDLNYYNDIRKEDEVIKSSKDNKFKIEKIKKVGSITYIYTTQ